MRQQVHDIVHVEIFTGGSTGEATIGSLCWKCWRSGGKDGVQEFSSYRMEETEKWRLVRYHFASIDTWLNGICKSFCPDHDWHGHKVQRYKGGRSLFDLSQQGQQEEPAE